MSNPRKCWGTCALQAWGMAIAIAFQIGLAGSRVHATPTVVAWGDITNTPGQISSVSQLVAGESINAVVRNDGTIDEWRSTGAPQVWNTNVYAVTFGTYQSYYSILELKTNRTLGMPFLYAPPPPAGATNPIAIASGQNQFLVLKGDGTIVAWGLGFTNYMSEISNVVAIASGESHYVALKNDGTVTAWINSARTNVYTNVPPGLSNVVAIAAGDGFTMAL